MEGQKQVVIYLMADDHIEVEVQPLTMGDLCEIVGTDRKVADFVKQMPVTGLQPQETGRSVLSVLMLVEAITVQVRKQFAGIQAGEADTQKNEDVYLLMHSAVCF